MAVPKALAGLAGAFVLVPPLATLGFLLPAGKAKSHILENCRAFSPQEAVACLGVAVLGCSVSLAYALATGAHLFRESYGFIGGLAASCVYLYATAFAEELAWRAFFLKSLAAGGKKAGPLLLAGLAWAFWHIPMWVARNGMGAKDIPEKGGRAAYASITCSSRTRKCLISNSSTKSKGLPGSRSKEPRMSWNWGRQRVTPRRAVKASPSPFHKSSARATLSSSSSSARMAFVAA